MISITLDGDAALFAKLDAAQRNDVLRPPMVRSMARLKRTMVTGYSTPARPSYKRTGDYGRHWTEELQEDSDGITGVLGNAVRDRRYGRSYGPYVGDSERQARVHAGRWTHDEAAIEENLSEIERDFGTAIEGVF